MKDLRNNKKWLQVTTAITFVLQQIDPVHGMDTLDDQQALQKVLSIPPIKRPLKVAIYSKQIQNLPEALRAEQNQLHQSLLTSLGALEDTWSSVIQEIKRSFENETPAIKDEVSNKGFPNLVEATLSLWPPDFLREHDTLHHVSSLTSDHPGFERINSVISILKTLAENPATSPAMSSKLHELEKIYCSYRGDLCQTPPAKRGLLLFPVLMKTEFSDKTYLISCTKAYELLSINKHGIRTKKNETGSSVVTHISEIYAKQNLIKKRQDGSQEGTLNPALEWGMSAFHRLLFGEGLVSSALVSLPHVPLDRDLQGVKAQEKQRLIDKAMDINLSATDRPVIQNRLCEEQSFKSGLPYTLQITPEVEGVFIQDFLKEALNKPSLFEELDPYILQSLLLSSLLTNPADAKGDNLIVTLPDFRNRRKIISIDNDLALSSFIIEEQPGYHSLEARNILFAIPQFMEQTIEKSVRERFLSHNPSLFLLHWLKALECHKQQYQALLEQNFIDKQEYDNLSLSLQLKEGTIKHILDKFITLQKCISSSPSVTFQQLFEELSPLAAQTYKTLRERHDPLKVFEIIYRQDKSLEEILRAGEKKEVQTLLDKEHNLKNAYKVRTQSLLDALLELYEKTFTTQPEQSSHLQSFEEAILSFLTFFGGLDIPSHEIIALSLPIEKAAKEILSKPELLKKFDSSKLLESNILQYVKIYFYDPHHFVGNNVVLDHDLVCNFGINNTDMLFFLSLLSRLNQKIKDHLIALDLSYNGLTDKQIMPLLLPSNLSLLNLKRNRLSFLGLKKLLALPSLTELDFRENCPLESSKEISELAKLVIATNSLLSLKLDPINEWLRINYMNKDLILRTQYTDINDQLKGSFFRKIHISSLKPNKETMEEEAYYKLLVGYLTLFEEQEIEFNVEAVSEQYCIGVLYFKAYSPWLAKTFYYWYDGTNVPDFQYRDNKKSREWFEKVQKNGNHLAETAKAIERLNKLENRKCSIQ